MFRQLALAALMGLAFALAWGGFIVQFGWAGALLGWWPAALIGAGGVLAVLQAAELASIRPQLARARRAPG